MKKSIIFIASVCSLFVLQNCSSSKNATAKIAEPVVSFKKDITPMLKASCTPCHFPPDGRKEPLNTYEAVKKNIADMINRVKLPKDDAKFMPFKNKRPALSDSSIKVLEQWQKQNMPQ